MGRDHPDGTIKALAMPGAPYEKAEWTARQGTEKNFSCAGDQIGRGSGISAGDTVPAGKVWVINEVGGSSVSWNATDGELNQICMLELSVNGIRRLKIGGNGGVYAALASPVILREGDLMGVAITNMANHDSSLFASAHGYEVEA